MWNSMWMLLLYVGIAGAVGGVVNALLTDNGFFLPRREQVDGTHLYRPGFLGNVLIGAVAATVSWGLYGPLASVLIAGAKNALEANASTGNVGLTLSSLVGAVMVGIAGSRWLTNEVDKNLLKAAASQAASAPPTPAASKQIALASPVEALNIAKGIASEPAR